MEKRYTVFVSSTFKDLVDARWAVARALMRLNLIPLGMENFTASDRGQWEVIKKTIDLSDYYVLILGNCYGSIDEKTGMSYTEKEYRYALEQGIPCLTFVSKDVPLKPEHRESDAHRKKLDAFRAEASAGRMVDFWTNPDELRMQVTTALAIARDESPRPGRVRDPQMNSEVVEELARLSHRNDELRGKISAIETARRSVVELDRELCSIEINLQVFYGSLRHRKMANEILSEIIPLKDIIRIIGSGLFSELSSSQIGNHIKDYIISFNPKAIDEIQKRYINDDELFVNQSISLSSLSNVINRLILKNVIEPSVKKRSVKDKDSYWKFSGIGLEIFLDINGL